MPGVDRRNESDLNQGTTMSAAARLTICEPTTLTRAFDEYTSANFYEVAWIFDRLEDPFEWTRLGFALAVQDSAAELSRAGVGPGASAVLCWDDAPSFIAAFWACQLLGVAAVPCPFEVSGARRASSESRFLQIVAKTGASVVLGSAAQISAAASLLTNVADRVSESILLLVSPAQQNPARRSALIQFTSGSTLEPRGCCISPLALEINARTIASMVEVDSVPSTGVTWCPLFHDMGLICAVVLPVVSRIRCVVIPTDRFALRPSHWLDQVSRHSASVTVGTNFSLALAERMASRAARLNLSSLRYLVTGAEQVDPALVRRFESAYRPAGLQPGVVKPAYGLAEATLLVTCSKGGLRSTFIDRDLAETGVAKSINSEGLEVASVGVAPDGFSVRIAESCDERVIGAVQVRSPCNCDGYLDDDAATSALFDGEWINTGDLGFLRDGELYIVGRSKDMIVIGGRNISAIDIEQVALDAAGKDISACAAVSYLDDRGSEVLAVILEGRTSGRDAVAESVQRRVAEVFGLGIRTLRIVDRGILPRTTSGKVQRHLVRRLVHTAEL